MRSLILKNLFQLFSCRSLEKVQDRNLSVTRGLGNNCPIKWNHLEVKKNTSDCGTTSPASSDLEASYFCKGILLFNKILSDHIFNSWHSNSPNEVFKPSFLPDPIPLQRDVDLIFETNRSWVSCRLRLWEVSKVCMMGKMLLIFFNIFPKQWACRKCYEKEGRGCLLSLFSCLLFFLVVDWKFSLKKLHSAQAGFSPAGLKQSFWNRAKSQQAAGKLLKPSSFWELRQSS